MPYMILGNNYFADIDNRHKPLMPIDYLMSHYTFEGQRIVFESPKSQLIRQGILLPITLQIYFHLTFYAFVRYNKCSNCFFAVTLLHSGAGGTAFKAKTATKRF